MTYGNIDGGARSISKPLAGHPDQAVRPKIQTVGGPQPLNAGLVSQGPPSTSQMTSTGDENETAAQRSKT